MDARRHRLRRAQRAGAEQPLPDGRRPQRQFEDRIIANGFWIDHAAEYAKRREARAMVVMFEGDPQFERYERAERFAWLRNRRACATASVS